MAENASTLEAAVDGARMVADLRQLDRLTGGSAGAQRLAWTPGWDRARLWLCEALDRIGMGFEIDGAGNLWAERPGPPGSPVVAVGSHLDSVPAGGWLDGALGTVAALEVLRAAEASSWRNATIRLVDWADEEGARFGSSTFGSSAVAGLLDLDGVMRLEDAEGNRLQEVLAGYGITAATMGAPSAELSGIDTLLELHIEQGPVLETAGVPLGVPTGAAAARRIAVTFTGKGGHAGTVPMDSRREAVAAGARLILAARSHAVEIGGLATCGTVGLTPNVANALAETAVFTLDLRGEEDGTVDRLEEAVRSSALVIAGEEGVEAEIDRIWSFPAVRFDPAVTRELERVVERLAPGAPRLTAGALHDAVTVASTGVPAAMLFVRSIGGVSHHRDEDTSEADLKLAARALAASVEQVAARPGRTGIAQPTTLEVQDDE